MLVTLVSIVTRLPLNIVFEDTVKIPVVISTLVELNVTSVELNVTSTTLAVNLEVEEFEVRTKTFAVEFVKAAFDTITKSPGVLTVPPLSVSVTETVLAEKTPLT
jgi:hypothetical protein